jgi:tryptophan synthase alpha chain
MTDVQTSGAERIEAAIRETAATGRPALAAFITAGYPDADTWLDTLRAVGDAADVIEVGVPFSDPMADGLTIQRASQAALNAGVSLDWILERLSERGDGPPVLLMSYLNPLIAYGLDALARAGREAGVCGFIVPDLPFEECGPLREAFEAEGLALVQLVTPITPPARRASLCAASRGFVYAVTQTGITGGSVELPDTTRAYLAAVKAESHVPVMAGFGIREPRQVEAIAPHASGAIVGTALIEALEDDQDPAAFLRWLRP